MLDLYAFVGDSVGVVTRWRPNPDNDGAHAALLEFLRQVVRGTFLQNVTVLHTSQIGNLGEFVSFFVGRHCAGCPGHDLCHPVNALTPLNPISHDGIDCIWLHVGDRPEDDSLIVQEVKTTTTANYGIANDLLDDFRRHFGTDSAKTMATRIQQLQTHLEIVDNRPDISDRLTRFIVPLAFLRSTKAIPTLVCDDQIMSLEQASRRLEYVRTSMVASGWAQDTIEPWLIVLTDLGQRFVRMANDSL